MIKVKRALISVSDKTGLLEFAKGLHALGIEIVSTGGTAEALKSGGLPVRQVSEYTGFPEILDGRVKTLHPAIHAGLLALREKPAHMAEIEKHGIGLIDMVVVNLYPFERVAQKNVSLHELLENIDIGGPSMLRSAAKNFKSVAVVCQPRRYGEILKELQGNSGLLPDSVLMSLAVDVFQHTARYDNIIFNVLNSRLKGAHLSEMPAEVVLRFRKVQDLRYGENPHQRAAFYGEAQDEGAGLAALKQLSGKELSFNNIYDLHAAVAVVRGFENPAAVIIKHNNPTGIAEDKILSRAFGQALACDPVSAFGGIIGFNRKVDLKTAQAVTLSGFMECIAAPGYDRRALDLLTKKKNFRIIEVELRLFGKTRYDYKHVDGGVLMQEKDEKVLTPADLRVATQKKPTAGQMASLLFAWKAVKHVRSNAIVLVKGTKTVGIGCGQTSRVESTALAIKKAGRQAKGSFLASEAFIPKTDNIQLAARAGIKAIIQPGGSIADEEVIKAANRAGIAMVFTGIRHFKH